MSYRLPPLNGLRAFEAAARHLSFKLAASELCVTPGAVSQQVKALEAKLGLALFDRRSNGLILRPEGERYQAEISQAFDMISLATEAVAPALNGRALRVGIDSLRLGTETSDVLRTELAAKGFDAKSRAGMEAVLSGEVDALLRPFLSRHAELALEHFRVAGAHEAITLAIRPGFAGCAAHRDLLALLRSVGR